MRKINLLFWKKFWIFDYNNFHWVDLVTAVLDYGHKSGGKNNQARSRILSDVEYLKRKQMEKNYGLTLNIERTDTHLQELEKKHWGIEAPDLSKTNVFFYSYKKTEIPKQNQRT